MAAGNWDFTVDSEIQDDLVDKINSTAEKFDNQVDSLYSQIESLGTAWVGEDYDSFKTGTEGYKTALHDLANGMRLFSGHFTEISTGTDELATEIINLINSCTMGKDGALGGNIPSGPNGTYSTPDYSDNQVDGTTHQDENIPDGYTSTNYVDQNGNNVYVDLNGNFVDVNGNRVDVGTLQNKSTNMNDSNKDSSNSEETEKESLWGKIGARYAGHFDDMVSDVKDRWSNVNGLITGTFALADTVVEGADFLVDGALDTVEGALDVVDYSANWLFDIGTGRGGSTSGDYWKNIGEDYSENWDAVRNADDFWEGAGGVVTGTVRTIVDVGQTAVNAADTALDWCGDRISDVVDWTGDAVGKLGGWLFG